VFMSQQRGELLMCALYVFGHVRVIDTDLNRQCVHEQVYDPVGAEFFLHAPEQDSLEYDVVSAGKFG